MEKSPLSSQNLTRLRRLTVEELPTVLEVAREDAHSQLVLPSHVIESRGQVAGTLSLDVAALTLGWFHTQRLNRVQTVKMLQRMETYHEDRGRNWIACAATAESPLRSVLAGMGYEDHGPFHLMFKRVG